MLSRLGWLLFHNCIFFLHVFMIFNEFTCSWICNVQNLAKQSTAIYHTVCNIHWSYTSASTWYAVLMVDTCYCFICFLLLKISRLLKPNGPNFNLHCYHIIFNACILKQSTHSKSFKWYKNMQMLCHILWCRQSKNHASLICTQKFLCCAQMEFKHLHKTYRLPFLCSGAKNIKQ